MQTYYQTSNTEGFHITEVDTEEGALRFLWPSNKKSNKEKYYYSPSLRENNQKSLVCFSQLVTGPWSWQGRGWEQLGFF